MKNEISLMMIRFKREENSEMERGILVNEGDLILDAAGKPVNVPIWNYWRREFEFSILLDMNKG